MHFAASAAAAGCPFTENTDPPTAQKQKLCAFLLKFVDYLSPREKIDDDLLICRDVSLKAARETHKHRELNVYSGLISAKKYLWNSSTELLKKQNFRLFNRFQ